MKSLLKGFITSFLSVYFTSQIKSGLLIKNGWQGYFSSALLLLLILFLKSFADTLLFPLNLLTLNLTKWITFILFVYFWVLVSPDAQSSPLAVPDSQLGPLVFSQSVLPYWQSAIIISLLIIFYLQFFKWLMK